MEVVEPETSKRMRFVFASRKTTKFRNFSKEQDIRRYRYNYRNFYILFYFVYTLFNLYICIFCSKKNSN